MMHIQLDGVEFMVLNSRKRMVGEMIQTAATQVVLVDCQEEGSWMIALLFILQAWPDFGGQAQ